VDSIRQRFASSDLAPATIAAYCWALRDLERFLDGRIASDELVRTWWAEHGRSDACLGTQRVRAAAVSAYWRPRASPLRGMRVRGRASVPHTAPSAEQFGQMLVASARLPGSEHRRAQAGAIVHVAAYGGLRQGEIRSLELDDLDLPRGRLWLRQTKGRRSEWQPLAPPALRSLQQLIAERPAAATQALLVHRGRRMGRAALNTLWSDLVRVAGLADARLSIHGLRHWFAGELLRTGATLPEISTLLRHRSLRVTEVYLRQIERPDLAHALARMDPEAAADARGLF